MKNKQYVYYQPNKRDIKDEHGDCVIRALTKATNKDWFTIFDELIPYARELPALPNNKVAYEKYLLDNGFKYFGISNRKGSKRPTVLGFAESHEEGTYVLNIANHMVSVVDGRYYDTWNCGWKSLYGFWEKKS